MGAINNVIYFNNNRTTAIDPEVEAVFKTYKALSLSPADKQKVIIAARETLAELLNCLPGEVIFTKGTTPGLRQGIEAIVNNNTFPKKHIISTVTEHPAVLDVLGDLEKKGAEITLLPVDPEGMIDLNDLRKVIEEDTVLVAVMAANNETGVIQDLEGISLICRENQIPFLSDASQYVGKVRCDVVETGFDMLAFGGHKMYGPEGIGVLYVKNNLVPIADLLHSEEDLSVAQIAGMAKAAEIFVRDYWEVNAHASKLRNYLEHQLLDIEGLRINGSTRNRLYNTSNLTFPEKKDIFSLLSSFDLAHNKKRPSHVLKAMGISDADNKNSYRFSFGRNNTLEEIKSFLAAISG